MTDHTLEDRKNLSALVSGGTKREVKKAAKEEFGRGVKVKGAITLSESEKKRLAQKTVTQRTRGGVPKTAKRGTRVKKFAIILPEKKRRIKPTQERRFRGTPMI